MTFLGVGGKRIESRVFRVIRTCWDLKVLESFRLGNIINRCAGGHTSRQTLHTFLEVRNRFGPIGYDSHRIGGRHKCAFTVDHVPITITIARSAEWDILLLYTLNERVRVSEVGIGMPSTEIR